MALKYYMWLALCLSVTCEHTYGFGKSHATHIGAIITCDPLRSRTTPLALFWVGRVYSQPKSMDTPSQQSCAWRCRWTSHPPHPRKPPGPCRSPAPRAPSGASSSGSDGSAGTCRQSTFCGNSTPTGSRSWAQTTPSLCAAPTLWLHPAPRLCSHPPPRPSSGGLSWSPRSQARLCPGRSARGCRAGPGGPRRPWCWSGCQTGWARVLRCWGPEWLALGKEEIENGYLVLNVPSAMLVYVSIPVLCTVSHLSGINRDFLLRFLLDYS